ncbi:hypothetical protein OQA88_4241 [Cercophora sp. LCS_1]
MDHQQQPESQRLAAMALNALAVAKRPLSILELSWAVALSRAPETVRTIDAVSKLANHHKIINLVRPVLAPVDLEDITKRQLKLANHSTGHTTLETSTPNHPNPLNPPAHTATHETFEAALLNTCIRYLLLPELAETPLFPPTLSAIHDLPGDTGLFSEDPLPPDNTLTPSWEEYEHQMPHYNPSDRGFGEFFVYAACHWTSHLSAIASKSLLPSLRDVELLCQAGSTRLQNWIAQNCLPTGLCSQSTIRV